MIADLTVPTKTIARNRRIKPSDVEAIADLCAEQLTESEACYQLGIVPKQWFNFKLKKHNQLEYDSILTRIKGARVKCMLDEIRKAAQGKDGVRHDWRAADRLLAVVAPERFSQASQVQAVINQTAIVMQLGGDEALRKLLDTVYAKPVQVDSKPALCVQQQDSNTIEAQVVDSQQS